MQLPKEEAFLMAETLYKKSQCRAHRRFGPDFPSYYEYRLKVEKWLYDSFVALGGKPQTKHPFYFVLQYCDNFYQNFEKGIEVRIPLKDIDNFDISFTFGDSMAQMEQETMKPLFLKSELFEYLKSFNNIVDDFLNYIKEPYICIEAQLWTNKYFLNKQGL